MKINFMPKTRSGKWVVGFGVAMVVLLAISLIFAMAIGGNSAIVASNSLLSILAATLSVMFTLAGPLSFFIGIYTIIRYKEWSIGRLFLAINLKNMKIIIAIITMAVFAVFVMTNQIMAADITVYCKSDGCSSTGNSYFFPSSVIWVPGKTLIRTFRIENQSGSKKELKVKING